MQSNCPCLQSGVDEPHHMCQVRESGPESGGDSSARLAVVHSTASCFVSLVASMRRVKCVAPDGETIIFRSAHSAGQHIKTKTGEDVSDYHVTNHAYRHGELLGFQLSFVTEEDRQQQQPRGASEPEEEILRPADGASGLSNSVDR
jgi:hypothetical protein